MEQFSGGGPPNPRFLPKLSMTVQVNHKKLYYNYNTLGTYLLKIQISGKILRQPPPPPSPTLDALLRSCRLTCTIVEKHKINSLRGFYNGRKKINFEPYPKHAVAMVTDFQHKNSTLQCSGEHCQCVQ